MKRYKSFLIINPFGIGDVLFSTPLLRNIKASYPQAKIYYLCNKKTFPVIQNHPLIEKAFIYERDEFINLQKRSWLEWFGRFLGFIDEIRKENIDVCLDLSLNSQYAFFAWLAGIRKRFGLDYKNRGIFLTKRIKIAGFIDKHVVDYYLDVLRLLDIQPKKLPLEVFTDSQSRVWAEGFISKNNISYADLIIGIAPCGGDAFGKDAYIKRWSAESFSELIDRLAGEFKAKIFLFAGPKEKADVSVIMDKVRNKRSVYEFTGTSLTETVALVERCDLFIGNDTGPLRFADGLNKKIIALFGPVDDKVYGPYPYDEKRTIVLKKDMPCRPCYNKFRISPCNNDRRCLRDIPVDMVMQAVSRLLN